MLEAVPPAPTKVVKAPINFKGTFDDLNAAHAQGTDDLLHTPAQAKKDNAEAYSDLLGKVKDFAELGELSKSVKEDFDVRVGDSQLKAQMTSDMGKAAESISLKEDIEKGDAEKKKNALRTAESLLYAPNWTSHESNLFQAVEDRILAGDVEVVKAVTGDLDYALRSNPSYPVAEVAHRVFTDAIANPRVPEDGKTLDPAIEKLRKTAITYADGEMYFKYNEDDARAKRQLETLKAVEDRILAGDVEVVKAVTGDLDYALRSNPSYPAAEMYARLIRQVNEKKIEIPFIAEKIASASGSDLLRSAYSVL